MGKVLWTHSAHLPHSWAGAWSSTPEPVRPGQKRFLPQPQLGQPVVLLSPEAPQPEGCVCVTQEGEEGLDSFSRFGVVGFLRELGGHSGKRRNEEGLGEKMERI